MYLLVVHLLLLIVNGHAQLNDDSSLVNDTVSDDPFFTVPILIRSSQLRHLNMSAPLSLCYEVHGTAGKYFNFITDECTSVNAHYRALNSFLNAIDEVAIRAVDNDGVCHYISVRAPDCSILIEQAPVTGSFESNGINITRDDSHVHINVPNCEGLPLSMWVRCKPCANLDPDLGREQFQEEVMTFVVQRHLHFGHKKTHGLIGQFWNIPMSVRPMLDNPRSTHTISYTSASLRERKNFTAILHPSSWFDQDSCLYVGSAQASSSSAGDANFTNDPVIEGTYMDYQLDEPFSEEGYLFGQFNEERCSVRTTATTGTLTSDTTGSTGTGTAEGGVDVVMGGKIAIGVGTGCILVVMAIALGCFIHKLANLKKSRKTSNSSNEINQSEKYIESSGGIYDDIMENPQRESTLERNLSYFTKLDESYKSPNHVYDEIHGHILAVRVEEVKVVSGKC